jgi:hypothetical protein
MLYQDILLRETAGLPEYLKRELLDFLFFLKKKDAAKSYTSAGANLPTPKPAFGCGAVKIKIAPDFDAPLEDFKEYMQ